MGGINSDGINPRAGLILSGGTVYGTTLVGGSFGDGTLFKVNTNGTGFAALHIFSALDFSGIGTPNSDGAFPRAPLVVSGGTLYGTARHGPSGWGTVFAIDTDATGFTNVYNFTGGSDGAQPDSGLILSGKVLYGTAYSGGNGYGTVFALSTDGASFTTLYNFTGGNDGANPNGRLVLSGSTLYGTTSSGGSSGSGTVFAVDRNGSNFTNLYSFTATDQTYHTNSDGVGPGGSLILAGDTIYGMAIGGGSSAAGTLFTVHTNGTGFRTVYSFNGTTDGRGPVGLVLSGSILYGAAGAGGSFGWGTVFTVRTDGTALSALHNFTNGRDGSSPAGDLILSGNMLYGATQGGGTSDTGTAFSISLPSITPPQLTMTPFGQNVILTWPTNSTAYTLQSTTNLTSPVWTTNLPAPVIVKGLNSVTNPISGTQQFYRLSQ
jgi:uncharacterized repeat protein (TIGR03803 family)